MSLSSSSAASASASGIPESSEADRVNLEKFKTKLVSVDFNIRTDDSKVWMDEARQFRTLIGNWINYPREFSLSQQNHLFNSKILPQIVKEIIGKKCNNEEAVELVKFFLLDLSRLCSIYLQREYDGIPATLAILFNNHENFYQKYGHRSNISTTSGANPADDLIGRINWLKNQACGAVLKVLNSKKEFELCEITSNDGTNILVSNYITYKDENFNIENDAEKFRPMDYEESDSRSSSAVLSSSASSSAPVNVDPQIYLGNSGGLSSSSNYSEISWRYSLQVGDRIDARNLDDHWTMAVILDIKYMGHQFTTEGISTFREITVDDFNAYPESSNKYFRVAFVGFAESSDLWINSLSVAISSFMSKSQGRRGDNPVREEVNFLVRPFGVETSGGGGGEMSPSSGESTLMFTNGFFFKRFRGSS